MKSETSNTFSKKNVSVLTCKGNTDNIPTYCSVSYFFQALPKSKIIVSEHQKGERRQKLLPLAVEESAKWMQLSIRLKMVNPLPQAETTSALTSK